jgi:preprotein translocase subunit YajC
MTGPAGKRTVNWKEAPMLGNVLAATAPKSSGFNPTTLILILVVVVAFYMLMIRPQRRRQQQAQQKQSSVQPGARVRTTAGMYATVVDVDGDDVVLEVAPGVEVRYMKRAIMDVVSPAEEDLAPAEETGAEDYPADDYAADGYAAEDAEHAGHDADAEPQDTVGHPEAASSDDAEETPYEQATGTKKD